MNAKQEQPGQTESPKIDREFSEGREEFERAGLVRAAGMAGIHKPTLQVLAMIAWLVAAFVLIAWVIWVPPGESIVRICAVGLIGASVGGCIGTAAGQMFRGACIGFLLIVPMLLLIVGLFR